MKINTNIKVINLTILNWIIEAFSVQKPIPKSCPKIDFAVGGQAVLEGVMMRSPNSITIAMRKKNKTIKVHKRKYQTLTQKYRALNFPILRGMINLVEMMVVGSKAINISANEMIDDEMTPKEKAEMRKKNKKWQMRLIEYLMFVFSLILAIALSIFLFKFLPLWITTLLETKFPYLTENYFIFNLIDGVLKMFMFLSYIFVLSLIPSFRRIFEYHGAEHKAIFTYENHLELTPKNAKKQTRFHPRCGTSFILIVFTISILVYTALPRQADFWSNLAVRLGFLPLIAGISYEYLKLSAKHTSNFIVKGLVVPGLWFQKLTTKEPSIPQLEVSLKSLEQALAMEAKK
ncbi:MAG: DUF1385 domain-containing protein [Candidatus Gracilibacteria bacterium]|nr:DUF1385 domain-containing protein [Candidatus Gracilibacteria bacterium]